MHLDTVLATGRVRSLGEGQVHKSANEWSDSSINSSGYSPMTTPATTGVYDSFRSLGATPDLLHPVIHGVNSLTSSQYNGDELRGLDTGAVPIDS